MTLDAAAVTAVGELADGTGAWVATQRPSGRGLPHIVVDATARPVRMPWVQSATVLVWIHAASDGQALEIGQMLWRAADAGAADGVGVAALVPRIPPELRPDPDEPDVAHRALVVFDATVVAD